MIPYLPATPPAIVQDRGRALPLPAFDLKDYRPRKSIFFAQFEHVDRYGRVLWRSPRMPNILHDQGEQAILSAYFDTDLASYGAPPANLYAGLRANSAAEADTLASGLTELANSGYARQAVSTTTGHTLSQVTGDYRATTGTITWTNNSGSAWTAAVAGFVCTVSSGTSGLLVASFALSATRTLQGSGDALNFSYYVGLSE